MLHGLRGGSFWGADGHRWLKPGAWGCKTKGHSDPTRRGFRPTIMRPHGRIAIRQYLILTHVGGRGAFSRLQIEYGPHPLNPGSMFKKVLIANRGEIAFRVIRTLQKLGIRSVAVYSDADVHAMHVAIANEAFRIAAASAAQSYLDGDQILRVAKQSGAQAVHPGYGFLSENADFAEHCEDSEIRFVGPTPGQIRSFGLKHVARDLAAKANVPFLPGSRLLADAQDALKAGEEIGYPVMVKSTAGGGGIGLQL